MTVKDFTRIGKRYFVRSRGRIYWIYRGRYGWVVNVVRKQKRKKQIRAQYCEDSWDHSLSRTKKKNRISFVPNSFKTLDEAIMEVTARDIARLSDLDCEE